eukprot:TRINITY_DN64586_c0_g1_i1.p1 TRINITY_DN64586_c0_g1~~TRINITY_DN64586_c0_g1_i1.p1  ORF type:complete len:286 (+),score=51.98 TRINITY_DN64586_c0_g1_i1:101-958(+)
MAAALMSAAPGICAKTMLNQCCQQLNKVPISKEDIVYTVNLVGPQMHQAVVRLNCLEGQEFAGEVQGTPKEAEKAAALQALEAHAATFAAAAQAAGAAKKRKRSWDDAVSSVPGMMSMGNLEGIYASQVPEGPGQVFAAAEQAAKRFNLGNPALTDKVKLNSVCMKVARRALMKGDTVYESRPTTGGFQATVTLACLPGEWGNATWAGEVCSTKQAAEQSAASIALSMINEDAELQGIVNTPRSPNSGCKAKGKGKGKAFGKNAAGYGGSWGTGAANSSATAQWI